METLRSFSVRALRNICLFSVVILGLIGIISSAGPRYVWRSNPPMETWDSTYVTARIEPTNMQNYGGGYNAFLLTVLNKTDKNIEIVWNKTLYIMNGRTNGTFMFEGVVYRERNNPKPSDIVFSKSTFSKIILPCNLVEFSKYWYNNPMPQGENGVYLTISIDGQETSEKITVNLFAERS